MTTEITPPARPPLPPQLARSVQLKVFVALRQAVDPGAMMAIREEHLDWVIAQERAGTILMSGPAKPCGGKIALNGLIVIRAENAEAAAAIAAQDPFVVAGALSFEICEWTIFEGSLTFTLNLSDSSLSLR